MTTFRRWFWPFLFVLIVYIVGVAIVATSGR